MTTADLPLMNRAGEVVAFAILDAQDYGWARRWRWHVAADGYACRGTRAAGKITLGREVLGLERGDKREADHINRNPLDNRRTNLRIVTRAQQMQNRGPHRGSSSPYRGVSWERRAGKWRAHAGLSGRTHFLGYFDNEEDAAAAAASFRREHMPFSEEAA